MAESLDWRGVAKARAGARIGSQVVYRQATASTNLLARSLLREGCADGTVVVCDDQTQGRGRLGRQWSLAPYSGLAVSICLRLPAGFALSCLTPAAALAVYDVVRALVGVRCTLKWPNDALVDGAKVCGILCELDEAARGWAAVVGIGLNVNAAPGLQTASCLAAAVGRPLQREPLLVELLAALDGYLSRATSSPAEIIQLWRERLATLGTRVVVRTPGAVIEGLAVDVDAEGALLVRRDDGAIEAIRAGDVTLAVDGA